METKFDRGVVSPGISPFTVHVRPCEGVCRFSRHNAGVSQRRSGHLCFAFCKPIKPATRRRYTKKVHHHEDRIGVGELIDSASLTRSTFPSLLVTGTDLPSTCGRLVQWSEKCWREGRCFPAGATSTSCTRSSRYAQQWAHARKGQSVIARLLPWFGA